MIDVRVRQVAGSVTSKMVAAYCLVVGVIFVFFNDTATTEIYTE